MGVYTQLHGFKASESNTYEDYFMANFDEYWEKDKTKVDIYEEHLQTTSKETLIDLAIEGNEKYVWANDLAYQRGLEIENLKSSRNQEFQTFNSQLLEQKQISLGLAITLGVVILGIVIKVTLNKIKANVRKELIEEIKESQNSWDKY